MHPLGKTAAGLLVALTALTGCSATSTSSAPPPTQVPEQRAGARPQAGPDALETVGSCATLLRAYVHDGVRNTGAYGWKDQYFAWEDRRMALDSLSSVQSAGPWAGPWAGPGATPAGSATGTNTQESAVDEPDVAKTNGTLVARIVDDTRLVLFDVTGAEPRVTRRLQLPRHGYQSELLLIGDRVLITQQIYLRKRRATDGIPFGPRDVGQPAVRVLQVDIADPAAPKLLSSDLYSGTEAGLRQYGSTLRLATSTDRPNLPWIYPHKGFSRAAATRHNRALVRATTIEDWLPWVRHHGTRSALVGCDQVFRPRQSAQGRIPGQTLTVTTFELGSERRSSVGITAEAPVLYSSTDRLYVASNDAPRPHFLGGPFGGRALTTRAPVTHLHAFGIDGASTTYLGSGHVAGTVRDRWSLDEHDGRLRVVSTRPTRRGSVQQLTVLNERAGALVPISRVAGLGRNESLRSVRWFDDLAVLVTFRQVDPLITVDLSTPDRPRTLGLLKVPGYSGYLHPVGDHLLLGLGANVSRNGNDRGAQAAVFDIADPRHPQRVSQVGFGASTWLSAQDDPHGFTWVPALRTAVTSLQNWERGGSDLVALRIGASGRLRTEVLAHLNDDWQARTLALPGDRIAVLDHHRVRLVDLG